VSGNVFRHRLRSKFFTSSPVTGLAVCRHGSPRVTGLPGRCGPGVAHATCRQKWQMPCMYSHVVHNGVCWLGFHGSFRIRQLAKQVLHHCPVMRPQSTQALAREMRPSLNARTSRGGKDMWWGGMRDLFLALSQMLFLISSTSYMRPRTGGFLRVVSLLLVSFSVTL
jgi:uncharacterized membrane protein